MNANEIYAHLAEQAPKWGLPVIITLANSISFQSYWVGVCWDGEYIRLKNHPENDEPETTVPFEQFARVILSSSGI